MSSVYGTAFRTSLQPLDPEGFNLTDVAYETPTTGAWTIGQCLIDTVTLPTRGIQSQWAVNTLSVTANLRGNILGSSTGVCGKLGKIVAGISLQGTQTPAPGYAAGSSVAAYPLPRNISLIAPMWDPASDPLPAIGTRAMATRPPDPLLNIGTAVTPSQPLIVPAGANLYVGIWMLPSLIENFYSPAFEPCVALEVYDAQYEISYDPIVDGQGPLPH